MENYALTKEEALTRLYSLAWSSGAMLAAGLLDLAGQSLHLFNLPVWAIGLLGLLIAQLTKFIRNYLDGQAMEAMWKADVEEFNRDIEELKEKWDREVAEIVADTKTKKPSNTSKSAKSSKTAKSIKNSGKKARA